MNAHPVLGAQIIAPVTKLAPELPIIRHHHEWYNGSGYPDRLIGDEIPKLARILHVADAFEAMTAARPYRMTPLTPEQAIARFEALRARIPVEHFMMMMPPGLPAERFVEHAQLFADAVIPAFRSSGGSAIARQGEEKGEGRG